MVGPSPCSMGEPRWCGIFYHAERRRAFALAGGLEPPRIGVWEKGERGGLVPSLLCRGRGGRCRLPPSVGELLGKVGEGGRNE